MRTSMAVKHTRFDEVWDSISALIAYLHAKNIDLPPQSRLALAVDRGRQAVQAWRDNSIPSSLDVHLYLGDLADVWWLSSLISRIRGTPFEGEVVPKLALLAKGDPRALSPGPRSRGRDAMFELILGSICSLFATDVRFAEPDILCTHNHIRWGLAAKVAYGSSKTSAGSIRTGMRQIEKSGVDLGLVVIQMTNRFPHEQMYAVDDSTGKYIYFNYERAQRMLFQSLFHSIIQELNHQVVSLLRRRPRKGDHRVRGFVPVASTIAYFRQSRTIMSNVALSRVSRLATTAEEDFARLLNKYWQDI